jgi:hypothetical protein
MELKGQTNGVRHIGHMAEDFKAAFGVGETDTGITTSTPFSRLSRN